MVSLASRLRVVFVLLFLFVLGFSVSGGFDRSKTGVGFYRNVRVSVTGENFTGDNFLSKEGLHWSDKTRVEPITARRLGGY